MFITSNINIKRHTHASFYPVSLETFHSLHGLTCRLKRSTALAIWRMYCCRYLFIDRQSLVKVTLTFLAIQGFPYIHLTKSLPIVPQMCKLSRWILKMFCVSFSRIHVFAIWCSFVVQF